MQAVQVLRLEVRASLAVHEKENLPLPLHGQACVRIVALAKLPIAPCFIRKPIVLRLRNQEQGEVSIERQLRRAPLPIEHLFHAHAEKARSLMAIQAEHIAPKLVEVLCRANDLVDRLLPSRLIRTPFGFALAGLLHRTQRAWPSPPVLVRVDDTLADCEARCLELLRPGHDASHGSPCLPHERASTSAYMQATRSCVVRSSCSSTATRRITASCCRAS